MLPFTSENLGISKTAVFSVALCEEGGLGSGGPVLMKKWISKQMTAVLVF